MRIYKTGEQAYIDAFREVMKFGTIVKPNKMQAKDIKGNDDFITKEIQMFNMCILDPSDLYVVSKDPKWCLEEFNERYDSDFVHNPGKAWKIREELWTPMLDSTGKFDYSYSDRINGNLAFITNELRNNPDSRQAVLSIWDRCIDVVRIGSDKRVPCSIYYQFQVRNNKLDIIYSMRSTDVAEHFSNDLYLANLVQNLVALNLDIPTGKLFFQSSSLHSYKKDWKDVV